MGIFKLILALILHADPHKFQLKKPIETTKKEKNSQTLIPKKDRQTYARILEESYQV